MKSERVLLITHWAPNVLLFRRGLLQQLVKRGSQAMVVAPDCPEFPKEELKQMGVEFFPIATQRNAYSPLERGRFQNGIQRAVEEWRPTAVVTFSHYPNISFARAIYPPPSLRWIAVTTGMGRFFTPVQGWRELVRNIFALGLMREYRKLALKATAVLALNRDDLALLQSWSSELKKKSFQLPLGEGVDLERFQIDQNKREQWRATHQIPDNATLCGYVGRLMPEKGVETFLDIAEQCHNPNRYWVMAGRSDLGGRGERLQRRIEQFSQRPRSILLPWQKELAPLYNALDLLIYPSHREGFPITPLEALASGTTVLLYDAPGSRELQGEGALHLSSLEPQLWLEKIESESKIDLQNRQFHARCTAEKYDHQLAIAQLLSFLDGTDVEKVEGKR